MTVATWNVNSVKARLPRLLAWLERERPDVVCLQELKVTDDAFPREEVRAAGYHAVVHGQKTYNGVAILSRQEPQDPRPGLDDGAQDLQARIVAATVAGVRIVSAYVPNGGEVGTPSYAYKLAWIRRLEAYLLRAGVPEVPLAVCGDFNIVPSDLDCHDPALWEGSVLYNPELRAAFQGLLDLGLRDTFRLHHPGERAYSWWDYRNLAFPRNAGLRIDFVLCTSPLAARCTRAGIARDERKGDRPSDHVPVWATFRD